MTVLEKYQYTEALENLAEEIAALLGERKQELSEFVIKTNHMTGELIFNHPAYKKGKHGSGEFIRHLAMLTNCSEAHLYFCIKFYEKYREVSNALETLQPDKKTLTWRQIVASFTESDETGKEQTACPHKPEDLYEVKMTICRKCGARVNEKHKEKAHATNT